MAGYDPYCYWDMSTSFDVYGPYVNNYYGHPGHQADDTSVSGMVEEPTLESSNSKGGSGTLTSEKEEVRVLVLLIFNSYESPASILIICLYRMLR